MGKLERETIMSYALSTTSCCIGTVGSDLPVEVW